MKPIVYPIKLYQGAAWRLESLFRDEAGDPLDLSSYEAELMIRRRTTEPEPVLTIGTTVGGIDTTNDSDINLIVRFSKQQTTDLPTRNQEIYDWVYDLVLWSSLDPEHTAVRLLEGQVSVSPAVTRTTT